MDLLAAVLDGTADVGRRCGNPDSSRVRIQAENTRILSQLNQAESAGMWLRFIQAESTRIPSRIISRERIAISSADSFMPEFNQSLTRATQPDTIKEQK